MVQVKRSTSALMFQAPSRAGYKRTFALLRLCFLARRLPGLLLLRLCSLLLLPNADFARVGAAGPVVRDFCKEQGDHDKIFAKGQSHTQVIVSTSLSSDSNIKYNFNKTT